MRRRTKFLKTSSGAAAPIYTSDFTSSLDGWTAFGTVTAFDYNQSIGGEDGCLYYWGTDIIQKANFLTVGLGYRITGKFYHVAGNAGSANVFSQYTVDAQLITVINGTWVDFDVTINSLAKNQLRVGMVSGNPRIYYLKDIKVYEL